MAYFMKSEKKVSIYLLILTFIDMYMRAMEKENSDALKNKLKPSRESDKSGSSYNKKTSQTDKNFISSDEVSTKP